MLIKVNLSNGCDIWGVWELYSNVHTNAVFYVGNDEKAEIRFGCNG